MAFKFYIDSQLTDQPDNDTELVTTIKRDSDLGGMLITQDVTLVYSANNNPEAGTISGYAYLKAAFDSGTCNEVSVEIRDEEGATETYQVYIGVMKVPSMTVKEGVINLSTKIDDNSFYSYIKNNRNIPFNLYATKSKNGVTIIPPQIYEVDMFVSATGVYHSTAGNTFRGYRIYDVFKFVLQAISDGVVGFESDFLQNAPGASLSPNDPIQLFLFDGAALSNPNTNPSLLVTFDQLLREVNKAKNLSFYIDQTDPSAPVFRLEPVEWFYNGLNVYEFDEPLEILTSVKSTKIYGTVKVGAEYNPKGSPPTYT